MLLNIIKIVFIMSTILFSVLIILHKRFTLKIKDNIKISNYVAAIAFFLVAYIISALLIMIISTGIKFKLLMLLFAIMPFIVGKFAQYEKIKLYSAIQIIIMVFSAIIVSVK